MKRKPVQKPNPQETRKDPQSEDIKALDRLAEKAFETARRRGELLNVDQINELVRRRRAG